MIKMNLLCRESNDNISSVFCYISVYMLYCSCRPTTSDFYLTIRFWAILLYFRPLMIFVLRRFFTDIKNVWFFVIFLVLNINLLIIGTRRIAFITFLKLFLCLHRRIDGRSFVIITCVFSEVSKKFAVLATLYVNSYLQLSVFLNAESTIIYPYIL